MPVIDIQPQLLTIFFFVMGIILGSFGNVIIFRFPQNRSLAGRSACMHCKHVLSPLELVPVISFLFLQGKCRKCGSAISWQYPIVEFISGVLFVVAQLSEMYFFSSMFLGIALWLMLLIAVIDFKTKLIPDALTICLGVIGIAHQLAVHKDVMFGGALTGFLFFGALWAVSRGRWLGNGDVFLAVALGLLLGAWTAMVVAIFCSYIIGLIAAVALLLAKKASRKTQLPFGPLLIAGVGIAYFFGQTIAWHLIPQF